MANIKISDLTAAAAASGTQEFEVNDSLTSKKVTGAQVLAYIESNLTIQNNAVTTAKIADNNVTLAKFQDIATASILGRNTAGTGDPEVLTGAQARTIVGADNASNLTTGTVGTARLASGTANSTTYLRGDQTWATVTSLPGTQGQVFTSSGTFTVPAGITTVKVTVIGGGGGGGSSRTPTCGTSRGGAGGGAGASTKFVTGLTPGGTVSVTVGAGGNGGSPNNAGGTGGTSSFGAHCSATGGGGGGHGFNGTGSLGSMGSGSSGDFNLTGVRMHNAGLEIGMAPMFGGIAANVGGDSNGNVGVNYGSGGTGSRSDSASRSGGAGSAGLVIVEW